MNTLLFKNISAENIALNPNETALRLKADRGYTNEQIESCLKLLKENINCKYISTRVEIKQNGSIFDLGFGEFESKSLEKNLTGCKEAFVFLITLGFECDRLLNKLSLTSPAQHFICDALASSMAEAVCDMAENEIKENILCNVRFSPGYGDLPLEIQPRLLDMLNAQKLAGITISKSYLMSPAKTITCIMGIVK